MARDAEARERLRAVESHLAAAPSAQPLAVDGKIAVMPVDYQPVNYRYVYKGELQASAASVDVYRRVKGFAGGAVAFIVAIAAVRFLLRYVRNHNFVPFGVYRVLVAVAFWTFVR